jgi:predicted nucleic acid-binding protein
VIIADTSGLLALFNDKEPDHHAVRQAAQSTEDALVLSPYVVAELDHLVATRHGTAAELAVLRELTSDAYEHTAISPDELAAATAVIDKYQDQEIGLTDASLVVLAERYRTRTILTLDHRHFTVLRPQQGGRFRLLP